MEKQLFEDQDLYSWSVCLAYLRHFPDAMLRYEFFDRAGTVYPEGFAKALSDQVADMDGLQMTVVGIKSLRTYTERYFPDWFYTFLSGLRLLSREVAFWQDQSGRLHGTIEGPAWRMVFWEQILLSRISELYHTWNGDNHYSAETESVRAARKAIAMVSAGVNFCDMGTRRRYTRDHHLLVIRSMLDAVRPMKAAEGSFFGTSNLWLASQFPELKCIGTMSHQWISVCAALYGPVEANKMAMKLWYDTYYGHLGCYLPDCFGTDAFYRNFSSEDAKLWQSVRIDSGDNIEEFEKLRDAYARLGVDPADRGVVFSNGLSPEEAIEIHRRVSGQMQDTYGIGTALTCDVLDVKPLNIVIKATAVKLTQRRGWENCVKLSCNSGKAVGDPATVEAYKTLLHYANI